MRFSIALLPDRASLDVLRRVMDKRGLPWPQEPHITLFSTEQASAEPILRALDGVSPLPAVSLVPDQLATLGNDGLVGILFDDCKALRDVQAAVYQRCAALLMPDRHYYAPLQWQPHLTLGRLSRGYEAGMRLPAALRLDQLVLFGLPGERRLASWPLPALAQSEEACR